MNILLITYYYKHKNAMASVRAIKLAKYFSAQGHDVTVLTSNQVDTWTKSYADPVPDERIAEYYAPEVKRWTFIQKYLASRKQRGLARMASASSVPQTQSVPKKKSLKARVKGFLSWLFYFTVAKQEDVCMFKGMKEEYKTAVNEHFDVAIATYPTYGAFLMGMWLKRRGYCDKLIADFRDPLYNPGFRSRGAESRYDKRCLKKIVSSADKLVCVSDGIAEGIREQYPKLGKPIGVITNGFDTDDVASSNHHVDFDSSKVNFVYVGALYHGKRCVDKLAEVLAELLRDGEIADGSFAFHYAGSDYSELIEQLRPYGLSDTAVDHGFVSRAESISMQKNATALLLLTWNESDYKGVVPGKLFEYMAIKSVPIVALVTGDVAESEVALMIRDSESGYAWEQATDNTDGLKQYVLRLFKGEITQQGSTDKYNYENISRRYAEFIKEK